MALNQVFHSEVRPLLQAVDTIRELFDHAKIEVDLPSIAVVGNQSAGKTSVLERLSGVDLPRGEGMVTRCALVLRMVNTSDPTTLPYATIRGGKSPEQRIELKDVAHHVSRLTDELAAPGEISEESIYLTVFSPEVPDLTLVDLPGIVYTDAQGKKSPITEAIHRLYKKHISKEGCVILCALPATVDFRTQQVTAWAHEVDPEGKRTLGVVTKIDKAEVDDANLGNRLLGVGPNAWTFKLGAVAVRNRTQAECEAGCDRASVAAAEQAYFQSHPALRALTPSQQATTLGCDALVRRLVHIQTEAIQAYLPSLEKAIRDKLALATTRLSQLPKVCIDAYDCLATFTALTQECANRCQEASLANYTRIHAFASLRKGVGGSSTHSYSPSPSPSPSSSAGTGSGDPAPPPPPHTHTSPTAASTASPTFAPYPPSALALHVMPRVQEHLEAFAAAIRGASPPIFSPRYRAHVAEAMRESGGCSLPDAACDHQVFGELVKGEVDGLREPALALAHGVGDYMAGFARALVAEYFAPFPALAACVSGALVDFLKVSLESVVGHVEEQCRMEGGGGGYTLDGDFTKGVRALRGWGGERGEKTRANPNFAPTPWSDAVCETLLGGGAVECGRGVAGVLTPGQRALEECAEDIPAAPAVLDTQLKLAVYRRIMHRRFIDQIAAFVRFHFPRRLKEEIAPYLQRTILASAAPEGGEGTSGGGGGGGGGGIDRLMALMAEPVWQSTERNLLLTSINSLSKAQRELKRGGLQSFVPTPAAAAAASKSNNATASPFTKVGGGDAGAAAIGVPVAAVVATAIPAM